MAVRNRSALCSLTEGDYTSSAVPEGHHPAIHLEPIKILTGSLYPPQSQDRLSGLPSLLIKCYYLDPSFITLLLDLPANLGKIQGSCTSSWFIPVPPSDLRTAIPLPTPALFQISHDAFCGVLKPTGSVSPTSLPNRSYGSPGSYNKSICFQSDSWVQTKPLELPQHDFLDLIRPVRGRHDRVVDCRNESPW